MEPDDPRHGTTTGYRAGCHEGCCRRAIADATADRRKRLYLSRGRALSIPPYRVHRRIQALVALGWSLSAISRAAGYHRSHIGLMLKRAGGMNEETAERIFALYDKLAMRMPPEGTRAEKIDASRARNIARRRGWAPPLAWVDIDDIDAEPAAGHNPRRLNDPAIADEYDEMVVERILGGDYRVPATAAERREVVARWPGDRNDLERRTGWNVHRYITRDDTAA